MPYNFALIGAAGYIAPRHLQAIKATGNELVVALDPNDSVGILDRYFFDAAFFTEFERFDRHVEKLRRLGESRRVHYVSICSPNYLHDAHIRFALRVGAHAICEKPLVLTPWNIDALEEFEAETGRRVYNVLQLRLHPAIRALRDRVAADPRRDKWDLDLTYLTSRGAWYLYSWKGKPEKSGGLAVNIGIHFFDMLMWIFGPAEGFEIHRSDERVVAGRLELARARVRFLLSIDRRHLPPAAKGTTYRSILMDGSEFEFSEGFTDLHTAVYADILAGGGFGLADARPSIDLTHRMKGAPVKRGAPADEHPMLAALG